MLARGLVAAIPVAAVLATATPASAVCIGSVPPLMICNPCGVVNEVGRPVGVQMICVQ